MVPMSFKESEIDVFVPFVGNIAETLEFPNTSDQKDEIRGLIKKSSASYTLISENTTLLGERRSRKPLLVCE